MAFLNFDNGIIVNPAMILEISPMSENRISLYVGNMDNRIVVSKEEFDREWKKAESAEGSKDLAQLTAAVQRLQQSIDRLAVRIPSSIRMHL